MIEARIGLAPGEVSRLYRQVANEIRNAIPELSQLLNNPAEEAALSRISALKSCAVNVGFNRFVTILSALMDAAAAADTGRVQALLDRLPAAIRQLIMQSGGEANVVNPDENGEFDEDGHGDGFVEGEPGASKTSAA